MKTTLAAVVVLTVLLLGGILVMRGNAPQPESQSKKTNREVALTCTTDMATEFHIHPTLEILVNGEKQLIPADIGIQSSCMNALHTHDMIGTIHVESPEKRDFTLADFFAVWEQPFSSQEVLGYKVDATHRIKVMVDGVEVDGYENTVLKDKEKIIISYEPI